MGLAMLGPIKKQEPWQDEIECIEGDSGEPYFAAHKIERLSMFLRRPDGSIACEIDSDGGEVKIVSDAEAHFCFSTEKLGALDPGLYRLGAFSFCDGKLKETVIFDTVEIVE